MARQLRKANDPRRRKKRAFADESGTIELLQPVRPATRLARWGPILLCMAAAIVVYIPCYDNGFVTWDDDHYIFDNHQVHYPDGIESIWFDVFEHEDSKFIRNGTKESRVSHQYYPMLFSMFWIQFRCHVWLNDADPQKTIEENIEDGKMTATSFHVVSAVMHAINAALLILAFRSLGISNWVATVATLLFTVHPMQVASVAWAAEVKNMMSLMFYLLSLMAYIRLRRSGGKWWWYVIALLMFQSALFSKTVAVTLPAMLFFTDRLLERRWLGQLVFNSMVRVLPFLVLSGIAAWTTINVEDRKRTIPIEDRERPLVAGATILFYPYKTILPIDQSPIYPLWDPDVQDPVWWLPLFGALTLAGLIIAFRRRLGPHFTWAVLMYAITQFPMLGFKNINYFQFAFVAEHYYYHGAVGLLLLLALGLDFARRAIKPPQCGNWIMSILVAALAVGFSVKTWRYCDVWETPDSFWQRTLKMNPKCWPGYYNTANARRREGIELFRAGDKEAAMEKFKIAAKNYERVAEIHKKIRQPFDQMISTYKAMGDFEQAYDACLRAIDRFPQILDFHEDALKLAVKLKRKDEIKRHLVNIGKLRMGFGQKQRRANNYCRAAKQFRAAFRAFFRAKQIDPQDKAVRTLRKQSEDLFRNMQSLCPTDQNK